MPFLQNKVTVHRLFLSGAVFVVLFAFLIVGLYTSSSNVHGDGKLHALIARDIAEQGHLVDHIPYDLLRTDREPAILYPLNYPQIFHFVLATLYFYGGEPVFELSACIFAALSVLFLYLLLQRLHPVIAVTSACVALLLVTERFVTTPLMEQLLLALSLASLFLLVSFLRTPSWRIAILLGMMTGLVASIKQQGLLLPVVTFSVIGVTLLLRRLRHQTVHVSLRRALLAGAFTCFFLLPPLADQVLRNGTIGYVPGTGTSGILNKIPLASSFFTSKYPRDEQANTYLKQRIGYINREPVSVFDVTMSFIGFPIQYTTLTAYTEVTIILLLVCNGLFLLGLFWLFRTSPLVAGTLLFSLVAEIALTVVTQSRIEQYHIFGVFIVAPFLLSGIAALFSFSRTKHPFLPVLFSCAIFVGLGFRYSDQIFDRLYAHSGRQEDQLIHAYLSSTAAIQKLIPPEAIVLSGETNFQYYDRRNVIWLSSGGMPEIYTILQSPDEQTASPWFDAYHIEYIFIDWSQLERVGLHDGIPASGLPSYIDTSPHFTNIYTYTENGVRLLSLYRVNPL